MVRDVVVLIDRQGGGAEVLRDRGYHLHSVLTLTELADALAAEGRMTEEEHGAVMAMLRGRAGDGPDRPESGR